MPHPIMIKDQMVDSLIEDFKTHLYKTRLTNSSIDYSVKLDELTDCKEAIIHFSITAYLKMLYLIHGFHTEIGWHGTVTRVENKENEFTINDIFVYPQKVSATSIDTEENELLKWLDELDGSVVNNLRLHGHSHSNMNAFFSSTDLKDQKEMINEQLTNNMFYIFMVCNKSMETKAVVYDLKNNIFYGEQDTKIVVDNVGVPAKFLEEARNIAKAKPSVNSFAIKTSHKKLKNKKESKPATKNADLYDDYEAYYQELGDRYYSNLYL